MIMWVMVLIQFAFVVSLLLQLRRSVRRLREAERRFSEEPE